MQSTMDAETISYERLVEICRSYSIPFDNAAIELCLLNDEFRTKLTKDTLLSPDEYELYTMLNRAEKTQGPEAYTDNNIDISLLQTPNLRSAVETLENFTETISKQTGIVQHQQDTLAQFFQTERQTANTRATFDNICHQQQKSQRESLAITIEQLSQNMDSRLTEIDRHRKEADEYQRKMADNIFRSDDKLLASLQKLGLALTTTGGDEELKAITRLRDICVRLIKYTVECIRMKLDRIYLEAVERAEETLSVRRVHEKYADGGRNAEAMIFLQNELESLYSEILPVAQMSVDQKHLDPALKSFSGKTRQSTVTSLLAFDYVNEGLDFLLEQIDLLFLRIETSRMHHHATSSIASTVRLELAAETTVPQKREDSHQYNLDDLPVQHRRSLYGQSLSPKRHRRRSSGLGDLVDIRPLDQLLQTLSITLPMKMQDLEDYDWQGNTHRNSYDGIVNAQVLKALLADREEKADSVSDNVQEAFEAGTVGLLADGRRALQMARNSVLAESSYSIVQLVDPEIDNSIDVVSQEVGKTRARLDDTIKDLDIACKGSISRDQLVAQWG